MVLLGEELGKYGARTSRGLFKWFRITHYPSSQGLGGYARQYFRERNRVDFVCRWVSLFIETGRSGCAVGACDRGRFRPQLDEAKF